MSCWMNWWTLDSHRQLTARSSKSERTHAHTPCTHTSRTPGLISSLADTLPRRVQSLRWPSPRCRPRSPTPSPGGQKVLNTRRTRSSLMSSNPSTYWWDVGMINWSSLFVAFRFINNTYYIVIGIVIQLMISFTWTSSTVSIRFIWHTLMCSLSFCLLFSFSTLLHFAVFYFRWTLTAVWWAATSWAALSWRPCCQGCLSSAWALTTGCFLPSVDVSM